MGKAGREQKPLRRARVRLRRIQLKNWASSYLPPFLFCFCWRPGLMSDF